MAVATLASVTVLVALISEVFVDSVQQAATALGIAPAFVGLIAVALVGGAAEMVSAFAAARKDRLDLSVGIALGSASQIALFVAPVLVFASYVIGPTPMDLQFWPGDYDADCDHGRLPGHQYRSLGMVCRRAGRDGLRDFRNDALSAAAACTMTLAVVSAKNVRLVNGGRMLPCLRQRRSVDLSMWRGRQMRPGRENCRG